MDVEQLFHQHKSTMFTVAYQMLGVVHDAEDIVHDVYLQLKEINITSVNHPKAYLTKMVTNKCLNYLQSARQQREVYIGPWLPEPLAGISSDNPLNQIVKKESISYAFTVILHKLTDLERCVFLLRETLALDYETIATTLQRSEQSVRKVYSRSRQKLREMNYENDSSIEEEKQLANLFIKSAESGDFEAFIEKLTENVVLTTDGGGKVLAALKPIYNKNKVSAFLRGTHQRGSFEGVFQLIDIHGELCIVQRVEGRNTKIILLDIHEHRINNIYFVMNPEKILQIGHNITP